MLKRSLRRCGSVPLRRPPPTCAPVLPPLPSPLPPVAFNTGATSRGLLHTTAVRYFLPPQVARLLMAAGAILANGFAIAYMREVKKVAREREEAGGGPGSATRPPMTALEAIQILGVEKINPAYLQLAAGESGASALLPLTAPNEREAARQNFEKMFDNAVTMNNYFLAGKLSAAYRLCVDANWDAKTADEKKKEEEEKAKRTKRIE